MKQKKLLSTKTSQGRREKHSNRGPKPARLAALAPDPATVATVPHLSGGSSLASSARSAQSEEQGPSVRSAWSHEEDVSSNGSDGPKRHRAVPPLTMSQLEAENAVSDRHSSRRSCSSHSRQSMRQTALSSNDSKTVVECAAQRTADPEAVQTRAPGALTTRLVKVCHFIACVTSLLMMRIA